jgi:hypothetical protein
VSRLADTKVGEYLHTLCSKSFTLAGDG